jgi:hypothetical protein
MPIVDIEAVCAGHVTDPSLSASALASALGHMFHSAVGRTWVRFRVLDSSCYAENDIQLANSELPVFVTVLHSYPPIGTALAAEALAITQCVGACLCRAPALVHVYYAPAGAGRHAFGGSLVPQAG